MIPDSSRDAMKTILAEAIRNGMLGVADVIRKLAETVEPASPSVAEAWAYKPTEDDIAARLRQFTGRSYPRSVHPDTPDTVDESRVSYANNPIPIRRHAIVRATPLRGMDNPSPLGMSNPPEGSPAGVDNA